MPVFLEVRSGSQTGKKIRLDSARLLRVGRTSHAGLSFADDSHMSGEHFRLECDGDAYRLTDLNSRNGTSVNGQGVHTAVLGNGDTIIAGETKFVFSVETDDATLLGALPSERASIAVTPQDQLLTLLRSDFQPLFAVLD